MMEAAAAPLLARARQALQTRDLRLAMELLQAAEAAGAPADVCAGDRWFVHALAGDYAAAWRESDALRLRDAPDVHRFWRGEPLEGRRLMLRSLHGLGDAVQMFRYLPLLQRRCAHLTVEVPPALVALAPYFLHADKDATIITWGDGAPSDPPQWDVQIEVMELPYLFRTPVEDLPYATNYLHLPAARCATAAVAMGSSQRKRVGLVQQCGAWNPSRDLPFDSVARLATDDRFEWWNLQDSARAATMPSMRCAADTVGDGLVPLAATIANLDLIVTPDTLVAHLAGALGVPAWVVLQHAADWRWLAKGDRSPWYPSIRLFRQPEPGDWISVFSAVHSALQEFA